MNPRLGPHQDVAPPAMDDGAEGKPRGRRQALSRRRGRPEESFLLIIVDHDNRRFTVEGPLTDAQSWMREIMGARRAGRRITCAVERGTPDDAAKQWKRRHGGKRWPTGSIVAPE